MLDGVMLLWFLLTAASLLFVVIDIRTTPESPVMKWGFVLLTAYTGVIGAFLYVLGCREPLPGTHEQYTAAQWRQTLGSAMHCVAGDGIGIIAGAVIASAFGITGLAEAALEYFLGFAFGWPIFQALFMRDMAGGSYRSALRSTFLSELLSMNLLMAGMIPTVMILRRHVEAAGDPSSPRFWFVMSMGLLVGFVVAYPMNWWLVANHLKHGMMTVRPASKPAAMAHGAGMDMAHGAAAMEMGGAGMEMGSPATGGHHFGGHASHGGGRMGHMSMEAGPKPRPPLPVMTVLSFITLAIGLAIALWA